MSCIAEGSGEDTAVVEGRGEDTAVVEESEARGKGIGDGEGENVKGDAAVTVYSQNQQHGRGE